MFNKKKLSESVRGHRRVSSLGISASVLAGALLSASAMAQQAGSIEGRVTMDDPAEAAGVTVTAKSKVMPRSRTVKTDEDGEFKLPLLIPGTYTLTFTAEDGTERTVNAQVLLDQSTNVVLDLDAELSTNEMEEVMVYGQVVNIGGEASLSNALGEDVVKGVPVGQQYRDLMKLLPGVQYTQDSVRGPSAGGSGQDNTYAFDGVDVTLPMFGTLSAEPSTHDVEQVAVERGGATAIGFNRSGGFAVNTKSKSGTNEFKGSVEYKLQPKALVGDTKAGTEYETDVSWMNANAGGPIIPERLFYYGSYYGPRTHRDNKETAYGPTKDYKSERDEYFGKLTYAATDDIMMNMSYRTSENVGKGGSIGYYETDSVSVGSQSNQDIFSLDGTWIINDSTTFTAEYSSYALESLGTPDVMLGLRPSTASGLDVSNLDQMGYLNVPEPEDGEDAYNAFIQPIIDMYGFTNDEGEILGGGGVGAYSQINEQSFYRESFEMSLDHTLEWGNTSHELHAGFRWSEGREKLQRTSNGWGSISVNGGRAYTSDAGQEYAAGEVYYVANVEQMSLVMADGSVVDPINSYSEAYNLEINDRIEYGDFTFNVGFLISQDILYGQGLRENSQNVSGFELAPGNKYEMYTVDWKDMIQPRLGVSWAYNGEDTVFANFASYNPEASSLARAASWDRGTQQRLEVLFDENGQFLEAAPRVGSSGKPFQEGIKPRRIDELTLGTTKGFDNGWSLRSHVRYREGSHFWEDTSNWSRTYGCYGPNQEHCVPDDIAAKGLYIPNLDEINAELDRGSSYVIAELDDAYTKYWEFSVEAEWVGERSYLNASYVRSRYTGNFDQDNTTNTNDANSFIGSSYLADGVGRQTWDNKEGVLRGDRPHIFKAYGYYTLDWNANLGAYFVYQSGQPWEAWDGSYYYNTSYNINRYAERAGSRRSPSHWQLDLNYTQDFKVMSDYTLKFRADLFNVFDRQTGYNINPYIDSEQFGEPRNRYSSRRAQLSIGLDF